MYHRLHLLFNTIRHMRFRQMYYQVFYKARNRLYHKTYGEPSPRTKPLEWESPLQYQNSWQEDNRFVFLNLEKSFDTIDWNFSEYGKLWTYNLTYFEFLNQNGISKEEGLGLIKDFIEKKDSLKDALEPYPLSLRGMNWVKFLSGNSIQDPEINTFLFNDYQRLVENLEYHLLGNHLLENGFALLFGAVYFKNEKYYQEGVQIIKSELKEQILNDGAHFELSPMYHQIILHRILDSIQLLRLNAWKQDGLLEFLNTNASLMLGWLQTITYENGDIPMVNDAAYGIAPTSKELFDYAHHLGLKWTKAILKDSGYRKWNSESFECFMDLGNVGPDYIPGHAHADTFNFELYVQGEPFIVDVGTSTYEKNSKRQLERSTESHNTVKVGGKNSSEVWSGFRVAKRAKITELIENENEYTASHNGYKKLGVVHQRSFKFEQQEIIIKDNLIGNTVKAIAYLNFHPSVKNVLLKDRTVECSEWNLEINFLGDRIKVEKSTYEWAEGFNKTMEGTAVKIMFTKELQTSIILKDPL
ncbi:MAG: alginate lyase family protein [Arenibacter troitsensis]|nr:alginate lyase family protein [Arenibacter troitsensis]